MKRPLQAIDFFCGAGGMTYGMSKAGIRVIAGIDNDATVENTYSANNPSSRFLNRDITELTVKELSKLTGIRRNDDRLVFIGCSPCQYWTKIFTDKKRSQKSAFLLMEFARFIRWFRPGYIVIENVPGILTNPDSVLPDFLKFLEKNSYTAAYDVLNSVQFGVPQNRKRFLLVATRLSDSVSLPEGKNDSSLTVRNFIGHFNGFPAIGDGHKDGRRFMHTTARLSPQNRERIRMTPPDGGTRASWKNSASLQIQAYQGKDEIFSDVYGRMHWDRPAPTITTKFISLSNGRFGHPEEHRALSLREGATLQTFPKSYLFHGASLGVIARHIGNAVPPKLAENVGNAVKKHLLRLQKRG